MANPAGNTCYGKSKKTLKGDFGEPPIEVPRDPRGSVELQRITKDQPAGAALTKISCHFKPVE